MKKVLDFCDNLNPLFVDYCGFPIVRVYSDYYEVFFHVRKTIRDLELLKCNSCDEFRMFYDDIKSCITLVYVFYKDNDEKKC